MNTPHDEHVLGGQRAMDETLDAEPVPAPRWTAWSILTAAGALAFLAGVVTYNVAVK